MKVAVFTSVLCLFSGLVSSRAVPAAEGGVSIIEARAVVATIQPSLFVVIAEFPVDIPAVKTPMVSKVNGWHSIQTLLQYSFPSGYSGKSCRFSFSKPTTVSGSAKIQLFTVGGPITTSNTFTWRPYRDQYKGTFNAKLGSTVATWDDGTPIWPCPASAVTLNFEVVPQNDNDRVTWSASTGGLVIEVY